MGALHEGHLSLDALVRALECRLHLLPRYRQKLAHVPYGSYPHECYGLYDAEPDHFGAYVESINARGSAAVQEYLDRYVYGPATYAEYLALFGTAVLVDAERRGKELVS